MDRKLKSSSLCLSAALPWMRTESMVCFLVRLLFEVQAKESEQHISMNFTSLFSCTSKKNPKVEVD